MYIRSYDGWEQERPPFSYANSGFSDGSEKETQISPEIVNYLTDLVFFARHWCLNPHGGSNNATMRLRHRCPPADRFVIGWTRSSPGFPHGYALVSGMPLCRGGAQLWQL
jgi:hypothetical protein